jgi:hypothetical protein
VLLAALAMLALRALTPEGYMPAAQGSGLLFELCPEGMPAEVMQALSGGGHHHHHGASSSGDATAGTSDCPIGHMLGSAVAHDADGVSNIAPDTPIWIIAGVRPAQGRRHPTYHSRAPPA